RARTRVASAPPLWGCRPRWSTTADGIGDARGISPNRRGQVRSYSRPMDATRPLHDVFADLAGTGHGEPAEVLRANGHGDLPDGLVAEAVVNYADTAPMEVAQHLAPFVRAHSP